MGAWTLCVRLIKSFEYRNIKVIVLRGVSPDTTVQELMVCIDKEIQSSAGLPPPFKTHNFNCLKIHSQAHGAKTSDTAINTDRDEELMLVPSSTLAQSSVCNETELSYFNKHDYHKYKDHPQMLW